VSNVDLLTWFEDDERTRCEACGRLTCVTVAGAPGFCVCLACGGVWVDGNRVDVARRFP
jgi:hypothetical protein